MCSICGILGSDALSNEEIIKKMSEEMFMRGPDQKGYFFHNDVAFAHNRLSIIDLEFGLQPMSRIYEGARYTIIYNGELYNTKEITDLIKKEGVELSTHCDTEAVLYAYILFGEKCSSLLNGIFAFAIYDEMRHQVYISRDRLGVKPFFYTESPGEFRFASEIKALLKHPSQKARLSIEGFWELLYLSPVRMDGVLDGIIELPPGCHGVWNKNQGFISKPYWQLSAKPFSDSPKDAVENTKLLLTDAIERQMVSDVPLCTLLSGGVDSSIISSVASAAMKREGGTLTTYSFEYEGNKENFESSLFQPQSDDDFAPYMANYIGSNHVILTASTKDTADYLYRATLARDLPGQADIDSSLLYFCRQIKKNHTVAISGECADEIFGGYPWFYRPEMLNNDFFPWIHSPKLRISLFKEKIARPEDGYFYIKERYENDKINCPYLESDSDSMKTSRLATFLSVKYFMASLLERKDRMSMASSLEVRVPFADHRIIEYVFNVPWEIKFENKTEKALLRNAMRDFLPDRILNRKKSPYPKTRNPLYDKLVLEKLNNTLKNSDSRLIELLDKNKLQSFIDSDNETWFGQLMGKPQLIAWLYQFDIWARALDIELN